MKILEKRIRLRNNSLKYALEPEEGITAKELLDKGIFLDLEHYIFKYPRCIGIFGGAVIEDGEFISTQFLLEGPHDLKRISEASYMYLSDMERRGKKYIITFAGKNDISVLHHFFKKYKFRYNIHDHFRHMDLQRYFERQYNSVIGLKALESLLDIRRDNEAVKGSRISDMFHRLLTDGGYMDRMPKEKVDNLLLYNMLDYLNLYYITVRWKRLSRKRISAYLEVRTKERQRRKAEREENQHHTKQ